MTFLRHTKHAFQPASSAKTYNIDFVHMNPFSMKHMLLLFSAKSSLSFRCLCVHSHCVANSMNFALYLSNVN